MKGESARGDSAAAAFSCLPPKKRASSRTHGEHFQRDDKRRRSWERTHPACWVLDTQGPALRDAPRDGPSAFSASPRWGSFWVRLGCTVSINLFLLAFQEIFLGLLQHRQHCFPGLLAVFRTDGAIHFPVIRI